MNPVGIGERGLLGTHCLGERELIHMWVVGGRVDGGLYRRHRSWKSRSVVVPVGIFLVTCPAYIENFWHQTPISILERCFREQQTNLLLIVSVAVAQQRRVRS